MYNIKLILLSVFLCIDLYNCSDDHATASCPSGWSVSTQNRCYKIIDNSKGNSTFELKACQNLPNATSSTLYTIQTADQYQEFKDIFNAITPAYSVYIGLTFTNGKWIWADGTALGSFTKWGPKADVSGKTGTYVITLVGETGDYLWNTNKGDVNVTNSLCLYSTPPPPIPWGQIQKDIADIKQQLKTVATLTTVFPTGYIYEQLPSQAPPKKLWPSLNWVDVTKNYAGLLFRAEGNGSSKFDDDTIVVQGASNFNNFTISTKGLTTVSYSGISDVRNTQMQNGNMSDELCPGVALNSMKLVFDEHDNRPINTAIRIWKRQ